MEGKDTCQLHNMKAEFFCLAVDCPGEVVVCKSCEQEGKHKHSKTEFVSIESLAKRWAESWTIDLAPITQMEKKVQNFYSELRKEINKTIDEDQKLTERYLQKLKLYHLPARAQMGTYARFKSGDLASIDRISLLSLVESVEHGEPLSKSLKIKTALDFIGSQVGKLQQKVASLKYVMLSKKLEAELLSPSLEEPSQVLNEDFFGKVYGLMNSRNMLVRHARCVYRASQHEFKREAFLKQCSGIRNCLAVARTKGNAVVGGFSPLEIVSHADLTEEKYGVDTKGRGFIFSITNLRSFDLKDCKKALVYSSEQEGPWFGADLRLGRIATSSIGHSYESPANTAVDSLEARVFLLDGQKVELKSFEVWELSL